MKPTQEQFAEYVDIRRSGITNMCDIRFIVSISTTGLTRDICMYIMNHFVELSDEFLIAI